MASDSATKKEKGKIAILSSLAGFRRAEMKEDSSGENLTTRDRISGDARLCACKKKKRC
jgi:hypothetical protein